MALKRALLVFILLSFTQWDTFSQVGIGTTTPDASSALEITSTTSGLLTPRMTTAQRTGISSPAVGLLVFDITENAFYYYNGGSWVRFEGARNNYKLIKSAADLSDELTAGGGTSYQLSTNTFYEINGTIVLSFPIDLNEAYIAGLDTNEDVLVHTGGTIFSGSAGGSIRNLTLVAAGVGGKIFDITGTNTETLVIQNSIIANTTNVGTIQDFSTVFMNIIQFSGNTDGITFTDINSLLLSNLGWFGNNAGTYETYTGTYSILEKQGGFSDVAGGATGIDVSSNPTVTNGSITGTSFTGAGTYVDPYTVGGFSGFNFSKEWNVLCPGLLTENDEVATGNLYVSSTATTSISASNTPTKMAGTTTGLNLFRTTSSTDNRITYTGTKTRFFTYTGSISVTASANGKRFVFYLAKNGSILPESEQSRKIANGADRGSISLSGVVELSTNDYVEVWVENINDATNITAESMNLLIK